MSKIVKLPALIDVHTHLREPGATHKEDFETGTKAAIAGGYTIILDMPNNPTPTISKEALEQKINLATNRIYSDIGFNFGATADNSKEFIKVKEKVFALKVYMNHTTGDLLMEDKEALSNTFKNWIKEKPIMVHAEGETVNLAIELAKRFGQKLHVCHVSLKEQIDAIKKVKDEGMEISCEVSCHHLFLTDKDAEKLGPYGVMRPPLVSREEQENLWQALQDGVIDMIASDHAPHTREEKETAVKVINGVPGLETSLPLLLTAVSEGRLTLEKLIELTSANPRRIFNIPHQPDTYVEVDIDEQYTINHELLYTKCSWTPFEGMEVSGKLKKVILRGQTVFEGGKVFGPFGQVIFPPQSQG